MSAVNITNFTLMQEYVANIMNVPVGKYYHVANNLHMYDNQRDAVNELAAMNVADYPSRHGRWTYPSRIPTLEKFDQLCLQLYHAEKLIYNGECDEFVTTGNDVFDDWTKVFLHHRTETSVPIPAFANPYLNDLFNVQ
jgi:thymidylate synthase